MGLSYPAWRCASIFLTRIAIIYIHATMQNRSEPHTRRPSIRRATSDAPRSKSSRNRTRLHPRLLVASLTRPPCQDPALLRDPIPASDGAVQTGRADRSQFMPLPWRARPHSLRAKPQRSATAKRCGHRGHWLSASNGTRTRTVGGGQTWLHRYLEMEMLARAHCLVSRSSQLARLLRRSVVPAVARFTSALSILNCYRLSEEAPGPAQRDRVRRQ